jgi:hypothetical protein
MTKLGLKELICTKTSTGKKGVRSGKVIGRSYEVCGGEARKASDAADTKRPGFKILLVVSIKECPTVFNWQ